MYDGKEDIATIQRENKMGCTAINQQNKNGRKQGDICPGEYKSTMTKMGWSMMGEKT